MELLSFVVPFLRIPFSVEVSYFLRPFLADSYENLVSFDSFERLLLKFIMLLADLFSELRRSS